MTDKMMRMAGRDNNGLAKPLSVDVDTDGKGVLRVVDAAPAGYNPNSDSIKVESSLGTEIMYEYRNSVLAPEGVSNLLDESRPIEIDKFEVRTFELERPDIRVFFGLYQSDGTLIYPFGNKIESGSHDYFRLEKAPPFPLDDIWQYKEGGGSTPRGGWAFKPEYLPLKCPFGAKIHLIAMDGTEAGKPLGSFVNYRVIG